MFHAQRNIHSLLSSSPSLIPCLNIPVSAGHFHPTCLTAIHTSNQTYQPSIKTSINSSKLSILLTFQQVGVQNLEIILHCPILSQGAAYPLPRLTLSNFFQFLCTDLTNPLLKPCLDFARIQTLTSTVQHLAAPTFTHSEWVSNKTSPMVRAVEQLTKQSVHHKDVFTL